MAQHIKQYLIIAGAARYILNYTKGLINTTFCCFYTYLKSVFRHLSLLF